MSNVHRLLHTDRIFFLSVNVRRRFKRFDEPEYALLIHVLEASRRRLGFLLCGYVLMPDHGHALIWPRLYPMLALTGLMQVSPNNGWALPKGSRQGRVSP